MNRSEPLNLRALLAGVAVGAVSLSAPAEGAVLVSRTTDVAPALEPYVNFTPYSPGFTASANLVQGLTANYTGTPNFEQSRGVAAWTDGSLSTVYAQQGSGGDATDHAAYGTVQSSSVITFDLGGLHNLSLINVFLGWNDAGRDQSGFSILTSMDGVTFDAIPGASYAIDSSIPVPSPNTSPLTHWIKFEDQVPGTDIASGVQYVRFQFNAADNNNAGIVEIEVFGQAIPEPGATLLGLLSGLFLLRRKRN